MPKKRTLEDFIASARKVHGDKYDYSKAEYKGVHTKLCIICPEHGEFWQEPNNHISRKTICPACARKLQADRQRSTTSEFIRKAEIAHEGKYDYSKVDYRGLYDNVCIICPTHGEFWQSPHNHINGSGCPKCSGNYTPTTEEFIESAKALLGDRYDYSKVVYTGNKTKVCIICPEHGEFWATPNNHLKGTGCPKCYGNAKIDKEEFLRRANTRFNGKYDYSKVEWKGYKRKVCIICPEHGEVWQTPYLHLRTQGCLKCSGSYMDQEFFIERATAIHGGKYDYSKVEYKTSKDPVCIVCPIHGEFWQKPNDHLMRHGCPACNNSVLEDTVMRLLKRHKIPFVAQKSFAWLSYSGPLHLDFFLYEHNIAIECQGIQHFEPIDHFGGKRVFADTKQRDMVKRQLCEQHGIRVLYFSNLGIHYPYTVIEDTGLLMQLIKGFGSTEIPIWTPDPELPLSE